MARSFVVPASRRFFLARSAAVLVAGATLPLLAACGAANITTAASGTATTSAASSGTISTNNSATASQQAGSASPAPTSQVISAQKAQGTVTWLIPEDPLIDKFANSGIVPAFEQAHPDVKVQVISPGSTENGQKLLALVAAGQTPEVFTDWGGGATFFTLRDHKLLTNLSPYLQRAGVNPDYLRPEYLDQYSIQGNLYAIPWNSNPVFIVYNKTLFEKYNVPLPPSDWNDKSWNTDKVLQAAQALTHNTGNPATSIFGFQMGAGSCGSLAWIWNADPFNNTGGPEDSPVYHGEPLTQVYATTKGMVDAMGWLADLTNKYHVSPNATETKAMSALGNPIFSGRIAMAQEAGGWLERQAAVAKPQFEWGIAPSPYGPSGKNTMQREDNAWYVGQGSKNPDAGFQLILFASRGVGADDLITFAEDNPPLSDPSYAQKWSSGILKIPGFSMTQQAFVSVFEGGVQAGHTDPAAIIADYSEFGNAFTQIMAPVWLGNQTPLDGLQAVQQKWQGIVATSQKQS